jgi:hypothetical protein
LQYRIFSADPWPVIADAIEHRCQKSLRETAFAFQDQAEDFYQSALDGRILHAKPLLIYYGMLNLAKSLILTEGLAPKDYKPHHGLRENAKPREIQGARVKVTGRQGKMPPLFTDFARAIGGTTLTLKNEYTLGNIFPQILTGHRLWCSAQGTVERFVGIDTVSILVDETAKELWVRIGIRKDDLAPLNVNETQLPERSGFGKGWHVVTTKASDAIIYIEQRNGRQYSGAPIEVAATAVSELRPMLWSSVLIVPPYTKYYLHLSPTSNRSDIMPQLLSMYLTMFFFGSITRYRPHHFNNLIRSDYGAFIEGVVNDIPRQFLYLAASVFLRREVVKAAIV